MTIRPSMDMGGLYDTGTLQYWGKRYSKSTNSILKILIDGLPAEEYRRLASMKLEFPLTNPELINFYAKVSTSVIVLPISSLKFLDDLCIAYSWLVINDYQLEPIEEYIAMLKYKRASDFQNGKYPPPLQALGIPANALNDRRVDDLSMRLFNSARALILAHELGHVYYQHRTRSISNEESADLFALEILRSNSTIPMGAIIFFQATAIWFPNRADFPNDKEWSIFLREKATHPLNSRRLRTLAAKLSLMDKDFAGNEQDPLAGAETIRFIGSNVLSIAEYLEDTDIQRCLAEYAVTTDPATLAPRSRHVQAKLDC